MKQAIKKVIFIVVVAFAFLCVSNVVSATSSESELNAARQKLVDFCEKWIIDTQGKKNSENISEGTALNIYPDKGEIYEKRGITYRAKEPQNVYYYDCVGWVSFALNRALGINCDGANSGNGGFVVPSMTDGVVDEKHFKRFEIVNGESDLVPGDILINSGHVTIYAGNGRIYNNRGSEENNGKGCLVRGNLDISKYTAYARLIDLTGKETTNSNNDGFINSFMKIAKQLADDPKVHYVWGADGPEKFDCASFISWCLRHAGEECSITALKGISFATASENDNLLKTGLFTRYNYNDVKDSLQVGDILLRRKDGAGHTEIFYENQNGVNYQIGAHGAEDYSTADSISVNKMGNNWNYVYRFNGSPFSGISEEEKKPGQTGTETYKVYDAEVNLDELPDYRFQGNPTEVSFNKGKSFLDYADIAIRFLGDVFEWIISFQLNVFKMVVVGWFEIVEKIGNIILQLFN